MITSPAICPLCNKKEPWLIPQYDRDTVKYDCCDAEITLTPALFICPFKKYEGKSIDEIDDEWYLNFLLKLAKEKEDWVLERCVTLKLQK